MFCLMSEQKFSSCCKTCNTHFEIYTCSRKLSFNQIYISKINIDSAVTTIGSVPEVFLPRLWHFQIVSFVSVTVVPTDRVTWLIYLMTVSLVQWHSVIGIFNNVNCRALVISKNLLCNISKKSRFYFWVFVFIVFKVYFFFC